MYGQISKDKSAAIKYQSISERGTLLRFKLIGPFN